MNNLLNNTAAIISDLIGTIQNVDASNRIVPKDPAAPAFITELGIRSLTFSSTPDGQALSGQHDLKSLFTNSHVISFADWSDIHGASDLWDNLLRDIIKPLFKKQFEFIFYLGDPTKKLVQEVDEILDIISGFSLYGQVTLVLNADEASRLWMVLNGYDPGMPLSALRFPSLRERSLAIFNTMNIDHLLIYNANQTLSFSKQGQFELVNRSHNNARIAKEVRNIFNAGYSLGLQLRLVTSQCVALGLAACGSFIENGISPDRSALLSYAKSWMAELGSSTKNFSTSDKKAPPPANAYSPISVWPPSPPSP